MARDTGQATRRRWRHSKFHSVRTACIAGHSHASKKEARACVDLQALEQTGEIKLLTQQPRFKLNVNGHHICDYIADFQYIDKRDKQRYVVDVKGVKTDVYRLKKKLMWACLGIEITET